MPMRPIFCGLMWFATHQLNLQPRVSRPEASPTSLWTRSPGVGLAFRVWGCLALVRDTSVDKLSARAIPCVFLGFPMDSPDYAFYHPPLHQFLDSSDVRRVSVLLRSLPLSRSPSSPSSPFPRTLSSSCSHSSGAPAPPWSCPVRLDSRGVGAGGAATSGTRSGGTHSRGAGAGGAGLGGAGAGGASIGGTSSGGAGVGGAGAGGASSGGAGAGETGTGGASSEETGVGDTISEVPTQPPHRHDTRLQAARQRAREEQKQLERERQELRQLDLLELLEQQQQQHQQEQQQQQQPQQQQLPQQLPLERQLLPSVSGLRALGLPSSSRVRSPSPPAFGPTLPPPDDSPAVWSSPRSPSSPLIVPHYRVRPCPPHDHPSSPVTDLRTALFCSSHRRSPPVSVLPFPPPSSLPISPTPISDYYRVARPVVSRVLATLATNSRFSPSSVSTLFVAVAAFAATSRLDYATRVVPAPPPRPLSVGGEFSLGYDVLDDRQSELEYLAATSPSLCAMLLSPEGDPDALDIPIPRTYREAVSGEWASQWKAAMDLELASWRSTGTYVDTVPPPRANAIDGMWPFKVKRSPGSSPVFKARYVARGFSQRKGVDFFQTFAPTPKMTTLRVLLHVAAQRDYELHSFDFSTAFLQGRLHEELPREWHDTFHSTLRGLGFCPSFADPSLFVCAGSTHFFILVYFSTTQPSPLAVDHRLIGPFPDEPFESSGPYAELVGCLMYLMTCTWPDLAFPLSFLACFVATGRHGPVHWTAAVRVAKYMETTSGMGLVLGGNRPVELTGHCDSSYADDMETQRSTQGYCFSLGACGVSWRSTRCSSVALSSVEAEI
ncbi:unnamed protein product [Closterium sp. NIES-53]